MKKRNLFLMTICIVLIVGSFLIGRNGSFGGADDQIQSRIEEVNKDYKPWFSHVWQPPSSEIESLLFALQAAIGAGFIGYYIGRKQNVKTHHRSSKDE